MTTVAHAHPCWADLSTTDVDAAVTFYRELLGWTIARIETPMGDYFVASIGDRDIAGMMAQPPDAEGNPSMWVDTFYVDDIDDAAEKVRSADGEVLEEPFEIPNGARVSVIGDSCGAMFDLISSEPQPGPYFSMEAGEVGWFELMSHDTAEAARFYAEVFGWTAATDDTADMPYTVFSLDDTPVGGMIATPPHLAGQVPDNWSVYFNVVDCAASERRAVELGGAVVLSATPTPMGPFAVIADPTGAVFQIMQYAEQSSSK